MDDGMLTPCTPLISADAEGKVEVEARGGMQNSLVVSCDRIREQQLPPSQPQMPRLCDPSRDCMTMNYHAYCLFWS